MGGYITGFIVYTAAMIGVIFLAVFVYSKFSFKSSSKSKFLNVEDCINLAPRKNLYVIRAGNEKFLIASDAERTSLISKLGSKTDYYSQTSTKYNVEEFPSIAELSSKKAASQRKIFKNIVNNI